MHFRLTGRYLLFLAALTLLLVEIHEQCHAIVTRLLCGGWPARVFDNVLTYRGCSATSLALVDLVGPLFSYAVLWIGALMCRRKSPMTRGLGLSLAFASLPLARVVPQVFVALVAGSSRTSMASFVESPAMPSGGPTRACWRCWSRWR